MEANRLTETFPDVVVAMSQLGTTLVTFCHDPDPQQMQSKLTTLLAEGLVGTPFISNSEENAKAQEDFVRECVLLLMAQAHDRDKEVMLSNFRRLSEMTPAEAMRIAREQDKDTPEAVQPAA